jgi:hypothetical protein
MKRARVILSLVFAACFGCGSFSNKPLLPKQSTNETASDSDQQEEWQQIVEKADVIYFPVETIRATGSEGNVAKLVQALRDAGTPFSIGWQGIEPDTGDQSPSNEPRWSYAGGLRDQCKMVMRDTIDARQLFLGLPRTVRAKLQSGSVLNAGERALLARGYRAPGSGLEDFAEQLAAVRGLQERDIENLYRVHVVAAQFAAEKIVTYMREHAGEKLLIFARRRELTGDCGLPAFVSQKLALRQITLDREHARTARPRLVSTGCDRRTRLL